MDRVDGVEVCEGFSNYQVAFEETFLYHMTSSVSGQMKRIQRCNRLPERARWSYLARSGLPAVSRKKKFSESHMINPLLSTKLVRSRWLDLNLVLFFACLWTETESRSINTQKERTWPISSHSDYTTTDNNVWSTQYIPPIKRAVTNLILFVLARSRFD